MEDLPGKKFLRERENKEREGQRMVQRRTSEEWPRVFSVDEYNPCSLAVLLARGGTSLQLSPPYLGPEVLP